MPATLTENGVNLDDEKVIDLVIGSSVVAKKYGDLLEKEAAQASQVQEALPKAVKALVDAGLVSQPAEKVASALSNHAVCLDVLRKTAARLISREAEAIGRVESEAKRATQDDRVRSRGERSSQPNESLRRLYEDLSGTGDFS